MSESYRRGDVFWAPDPFRDGSNPRLWLVLAADELPFPGEEYICATLTTSDLPANLEIGDSWERGQDPRRTSYCSPWSLGTIKHRSVVNPQGSVTMAFLERVIDNSVAYLSG